ncbi:hypothetical protein [Dyadobacter sp. CY326]|uniref:hypothetical protein n=1 Tax=Dyadobacter sp. CY326 TaxID=2907300 RepID=UPI001F4756BF|nr:hypothetical protein [Dyadobacter sp. CY326]MCE7067578.1 hypothetical protein [Dyadobacter sp. CY326]
MMDPSEINNFEDQWRKALKEASEAPPQSVWEGIEARLDQQEDKGMILPLWWQSPKIWYAAASIAALLLVGGIWYSNSKNGIKPNVEIASTQTAKERATAESDSQTAVAVNSAAAASAQIASENNVAEYSAKSGKSANQSNREVLAAVKQSESNVSPTRQNGVEGNSAATIAAAKEADNQATIDKNSTLAKVDKSPSAPINKANSNAVIATEAPENTNSLVPATAIAESEMALAMLSALPYSDLDVHMQKRYIFFRPDLKVEEPVEPLKSRDYYAALSLMPASFNPNLKVKEAPLGFTNQNLSSKKSVSGTSESGVSYAVQTQGGVKLSKHWSLEMGVSYLKGNSSYEGGGYVLSAFNNRSANVLENALAGLAPTPNNAYQDKNGFFANNGALYIDVAKTVSNNYQYLQLPVQAGFTIYPEKKLSYSVLGGMMANFFLSNELESASGEIITTKASDEIYRHMNWAATTGLRFSYKLSSKWNANLTGSYQKSVTSGFRSNQSLDSRPQLYGVSWGMRYSF